MYKQILINNLELSYPNNIIFENFSTQINHNDRIGIIGRNGSGKSTLIKVLLDELESTSGIINRVSSLNIGYVPQIINEFDKMSGGERFNKCISRELSNEKDILILDEPTNHLDHHNRQSLIRMLKNHFGTLIIASHDQELLSSCVDIIWHINDNAVNIFKGNYHDYLRNNHEKRNKLRKEIQELNKEKKNIHLNLMKEQKRAANSKRKGKKNIDNKKWPTVVSKAKLSRATKTSGEKKASLKNKKDHIKIELEGIYVQEIIQPTFSISANSINNNEQIVNIYNGTTGYSVEKPILEDINLYINNGEKIAIQGKNGSGKTTLIKSLLNIPNIIKTGDWYAPKLENIGYLDQHYNSLEPNKTIFDSVSDIKPEWGRKEIIEHLNKFLFRGNIEINRQIQHLSGGEKNRLSLVLIAAQTPTLLILDEITNNLDIENVEHLIQVLNLYPGAILMICHDYNFLQKIDIDRRYIVSEGTVIKKS
ncbi:MAG: ABC-F family ATP-binding cassette domain-containing protein [Legionellales bacterium]|nr:ABC-F family ATP-binding cassette domain-containing protein [Legionellales bacterium]